jgi:hypothetical protein
MNPDERFELLWTDFLEGDLDADGMADLQSLLAHHSHLQARATDLLQTHRLLGFAAQEERSSADVFAREVLNRLPKTDEAFVGAVMRELRPAPPSWPSFSWFSWRPLTAAAAGIALGIFCTSMLFAISPIRKAMKFTNVRTLLDGGFESGPAKVPAGFPRRTGEWMGDDAERVTSKTPKPSEGARVLRFNTAGAEPNEIGGSATGCDVYQLVDLRPLRAQISPQGEAMLKLSADFLDARPQTGPELQFVCRINLFAGSLENLHAIWPTGPDESLASGAGELKSHGGPGENGWRKLAAYCVLTPQADFALVRIICQVPKGSVEPAVFGQQFADNILLQLRTQSLEPDSVVAR